MKGPLSGLRKLLTTGNHEKCFLFHGHVEKRCEPRLISRFMMSPTGEQIIHIPGQQYTYCPISQEVKAIRK